MIISILAFLAIPSYSVLVKHVNVLYETSNERVKELTNTMILLKNARSITKKVFVKINLAIFSILYIQMMNF